MRALHSVQFLQSVAVRHGFERNFMVFRLPSYTRYTRTLIAGVISIRWQPHGRLLYPTCLNCVQKPGIIMQAGKQSGGAVSVGNKKSVTPKKGKSPAKSGRRHMSSSNQPTPFEKKLNPPFEEYWSKDKVQEGIKRGTLFEGNLTISYQKHDIAFVSNPHGGPDFIIDGLHNRNRALQNDVVVVKVVESNQETVECSSYSSVDNLVCSDSETLSSAVNIPTLSIPNPLEATISPSLPNGSLSDDALVVSHNPPSDTPSSSVIKSRDSSVIVPQSTTTTAHGSPSNTHSSACHDTTSHDLTNDGVPSSPQTENSGSPPLKETLVDWLYRETENSLQVTKKPEKQQRAKVVYISEKVHSRASAGSVQIFDKVKGLALFSPRDFRVPRVLIPLAELPKDLPQDIKKYASTIFVCHLKDWQRDSPFPNGKLLRSLGEAGMVESEMETLLLEYDIDAREFSEEVEECLPKESPWTIPKEEEERRRDFRGECVFTIDPETARDLDDALHIKRLSQDVYEIGVHIADVSYFVKPGTALDRVASRRATSTYLVHKVIPMLPRLLCENLCSLNPNEDKLSFSVVWELSIKGELLSQWIGRSIIRSCAKLSYGDAQNMIDGVWSDKALPPISCGIPIQKVVDSVVALNNLAGVLRKQRRSKGTLHLDQPKLHYFCNDSTGLPYGCEVYPIRPSNRMIEEYMLLANMTVARRIHGKFPEGAMLRRHPSPREMVLEDLVKSCAKIGFNLDASSAVSIQKCLDEYKGRKGQSPEQVELERLSLVIMCVKVMELAVYFSAAVQDGVSPHHYALNVPLYTHFTSPIRRYADVIVHRQLTNALGEGEPFTLSSDEVEEQAVQCNRKKKAAKIVGDMSIELFFSILLKEVGPQTYDAIVTTVQNKSFDVLVKKYGLIRRVFLNQLDLNSYEFMEGEGGATQLKLVWKADEGKKAVEQDLKVFSEVAVVLSESPKSVFKNKAVILPPSPH